MECHVIEHNIPKSAEGTYYTIPFPVPDGLERVAVFYSYKKLSGPLSGKLRKPAELLGIVDLGLMDNEGRFLGWSGSARRAVFVGPYASTRGYLMTGVTPGEWQIIVGAYKIPDPGLDVCYEITYTPKKPRWFSGDLHTHSNASDGQHDASGLFKKAAGSGLDFLAISNHNNYTDNLHPPVVPGLTFLPAVEWTHYRGHMNFFGVQTPFDNSFVANSEAEMLELVKSAREKGALVSVNHPKCTICPYLWESTDCFDLVEVWNGPMRKVNTNAISWWHEILIGGRRVPLVGGSDYHRDRSLVRFARPVTRVYALSPSAGDILKAVASGHSYITSSENGARLDLRCGSAMIGDSVIWQEGLELTIGATALLPGVRLKLVTSSGDTVPLKRTSAGRVKTRMPVPAGWRFVYLVAYRRLFGWDYVRAITNPVYFNHDAG